MDALATEVVPHLIEVLVAWKGEVLRREHVAIDGTVHIELAGGSRLRVVGGRLMIPENAIGGVHGQGPHHLTDTQMAIGTFVWFDIGELRVMARGVRGEDARVARTEVDRPLLISVLTSMAAASALLILFALTPPYISALDLQSQTLPARWVRVLHTPAEVHEDPWGEQQIVSTQEGMGDAGRTGRESAQPYPTGASDAAQLERRSRPESAPPPPGQSRYESLLNFARAGTDVGPILNSLDDSTYVGALAPIAQPMLRGTLIGESFGFGGLSLQGTGRGAGIAGPAVDEEVVPWGQGGTGFGTICGCRDRGLIGMGGGGIGSMIAAEEEARIEVRRRESSTPPRMRRTPLELHGQGLDAEQVHRAMRPHRGRVRHCYSAALHTRPDLVGAVQMSFMVGPSGDVLHAHASGDELPTTLADCVSNAVSALPFPVPFNGRPVSVSMSYVFDSP